MSKGIDWRQETTVHLSSQIQIVAFLGNHPENCYGIRSLEQRQFFLWKTGYKRRFSQRVTPIVIASGKFSFLPFHYLQNFSSNVEIPQERIHMAVPYRELFAYSKQK